MAASLVLQCEIANEVRLPHVIRCIFFKAFIRCSSLAGFRSDQSIPAKDIVDGTDTGNIRDTLFQQNGTDHQSTRVVMLFPRFNDQGLHLRRCTIGPMMRLPREFFTGGVLQVSFDPLVSSGTTDTVLKAKRCLALFMGEHTFNKFSAQHSFCDIPFFPWHKNQLLLMPQNTTFFSRGETPTFVNYVIAHNKARRPAKHMVNC